MKIGIVCSTYNERYTDALMEAALEGLKGHAKAVVARVPGAFEIPLILQRMAMAGSFDALIALGVIWKGETYHAELIAGACARACMDIMMKHDLPVVFEVLTVATDAQAKARCLSKRLNRGSEAAATAIQMAKFKMKEKNGR